MNKKTIVVLEVEYDFDELKTTQEFAEQCAVSLAVKPNYNSVVNDTKLVAVENLTENLIEQDVASKILERAGYFYITSLHRDDLECKGFDVSEITDEDMRMLAKLMRNDYCGQLFHSSMEILAECMDIPRMGEDECDDEYDNEE